LFLTRDLNISWFCSKKEYSDSQEV